MNKPQRPDNQKPISKSQQAENAKILYQLARKSLRKHDYSEAAEFLNSIPHDLRTRQIDELLQHTKKCFKEAENLEKVLRTRIDNQNYTDIDELLDRFLELKPNAKFALKLQKSLEAYRNIPEADRNYLFDHRGRLMPPEKDNLVIKATLGIGVLFFIALGVGFYLNKERWFAEGVGLSNSGSATIDQSKAEKSEAGDFDPTSAKSIVESANQYQSILAEDKRVRFLNPTIYWLNPTPKEELASLVNLNQSIKGELAGESRLFTPLRIAFRWCPPGSINMSNQPDASQTSATPRTVTIKHGFWISEHELTIEQLQQFVDPYVKRTVNNTEVDFVDWDIYRDEPAAPAPVVRVSDPYLFCKALNLQERLADRINHTWQFRLPTEAEWEYSARAGTTTDRYYGDDQTNAELASHGWFNSTDSSTKPADMARNRIQITGSKAPNPWGLKDIFGNVAELCDNRFENDYIDVVYQQPNYQQLVESQTFKARGGSIDTPPENIKADFSENILQNEFIEFPNGKLGIRIVLAHF